MRAKANVDPGVCGFKGSVTAESKDQMGMVEVEFTSDCPNLQKLEKKFEMNAFNITKDGCNTEIFEKFKSVAPPMCCPCPFLTAIYQVSKVAAGLALPKDIIIEIKKDE